LPRLRSKEAHNTTSACKHKNIAMAAAHIRKSNVVTMLLFLLPLMLSFTASFARMIGDPLPIIHSSPPPRGHVYPLPIIYSPPPPSWSFEEAREGVMEEPRLVPTGPNPEHNYPAPPPQTPSGPLSTIHSPVPAPMEEEKGGAMVVPRPVPFGPNPIHHGIPAPAPLPHHHRRHPPPPTPSQA
jgi:hypothetical protein